MAGSIKIFQCVQKCNRIIGIYQSQPSQKPQPINWAKIIVLMSCAEWMLTTAAFLAFVANSLFDYGFAIYILTIVIIGIVICYSFMLQLENTLKYIETCEAFIEKRIHSTVAYEELIGKIELLNMFFFFAVCISVALLYFTVAPYSLVRYYIFNMGEDSFFLLLPAWYPFDWKTLPGYLVGWLIQCVGTPPTAILITQFSNFVFGSGLLFIFMAKDITQDMVAFNITVEITSDENLKNRKLKNGFCDLVQVYLDAKQCILEFNQIVEYSLLAFFVWNMIAISSILVTFQFHLRADASDLFETVDLFFVLLWTILFIFLLCEPGERMTNKFVAFNDEVSRCNWHFLPIELQRMYIIFLADSQQPVKMLSYANITCERETFKEIIKTAFSYFMTMRRFKA